ncbi:hypothetical protein EV424DRAFT_1564531 [Suillus variegatus]|nr:hypothetical protein EV424DRAFT_1564531 [Suillus variegatus]
MPGNLEERYIRLGVFIICLACLITRFYKCSDADGIARAISLFREALTLCPPGHPSRDTTFKKLTLALKTRYERLQVSEDYNEAIPRYHECIRYFGCGWLQQAYASRYLMQHNHANLSLPVENFRLASGHPTKGFPSRIEMALRWVDEAAGHQYDSALDAYQLCLGLFNNHTVTRSSIISGCNCLAAVTKPMRRLRQH